MENKNQALGSRNMELGDPNTVFTSPSLSLERRGINAGTAPTPSRVFRGIRSFIIILLLVVTSFFPFEASADLFTPAPLDKLLTERCLPWQCFGGIIVKKKFKLCWTDVPGVPFPVPNPDAPAFHYYEVVQPWPPNFYGFYYIYTFVPDPVFTASTKLRNNPVKTVYVDGAYLPGAHLAYAETMCLVNGKSFPKETSIGTLVAGTIKVWGTGCKAGQVVLYDLAKCKSIKK